MVIIIITIGISSITMASLIYLTIPRIASTSVFYKAEI